MKNRRHLMKACSLLLALICIAGVLGVVSPTVEAKSGSLAVTGKTYTLGKKAKYNYATEEGAGERTSASNTAGTFELTGNVSSNGMENNFAAYNVKQGQISFTYTVREAYLDASETSWHNDTDGAKSVAGIELESKMESGAIIVQTSFDGKKWITEQIFSDIFNNSNPLGTLYTSKEIQLINGCYYQVIVAYKETRKVDATKILFYTYDNNYEYRQRVEVYQFYASTKDTAEVAASSAGALRVGTLYSVEKDNGFTGGTTVLSADDPHYNHEIGHFAINGYTRKSSVNSTENGWPVFLKNVGDKVTLWFVPEKDLDIDCLFGNPDLRISEDTNGQDSTFSFGPTNFKHGALIIRFTDYLGNPTKIEYIDFLASCLRTGADTRVQLFEEGKYEVTLDYEIENTKGFNTYTNYKITYNFEIRNGNCQVFPFDIKTNSELVDYSRTVNGFCLKMAKSRYLEIQVAYSVLKTDPTTGMISLDQRWDRPAKDSDSYEESGIYVFTVKNLYSGTPGNPEVAQKTIYVGTDVYLCALAANKISIDELNELISAGAEFSSDGSYILPEPDTTPETEPVVTNEDTEGPTETQLPATTPSIPEKEENVGPEKDVIQTNADTADMNAETEEESSSSIYLIGSLIVVFGIAGAVVIRKRSKK